MDSTGKSLYGLASFQHFSSGILESTAGVLPSQPTSAATIPVEYDVDEGRFVGYALANAGDVAVTVNLAVADENGNVIDRSVNITLAPAQQVARFLNQDVSMPQFKGSLVLSGQTGGSFVVVALVQNQSRLTVVPVIAAKTAKIP